MPALTELAPSGAGVWPAPACEALLPNQLVPAANAPQVASHLSYTPMAVSAQARRPMALTFCRVASSAVVAVGICVGVAGWCVEGTAGALRNFALCGTAEDAQQSCLPRLGVAGGGVQHRDHEDSRCR